MVGTAVYPVGVVRDQGEQLSLSTALASLGILPGVHQAILYVPSSDFRMHVNPALLDAVFYDASAAAGARYKTAAKAGSLVQDLSDRATAGASGTLLDAMQTGDRLYLCLSSLVAGLRVVMIGGSVNGETATLTVKYWNGSAWTDTSATDGTISGTATFAVTGSITWTAVTDWVAANLRTILTTAATPGTERDAPDTNGFWLQLTVSAALGADVELDNIWALNNDTNRGYYRLGQEYHISFDRRNAGAIEAVLAAGTATMDITWVRT